MSMLALSEDEYQPRVGRARMQGLEPQKDQVSNGLGLLEGKAAGPYRLRLPGLYGLAIM